GINVRPGLATAACLPDRHHVAVETELAPAAHQPRAETADQGRIQQYHARDAIAQCGRRKRADIATQRMPDQPQPVVGIDVRLDVVDHLPDQSRPARPDRVIAVMAKTRDRRYREAHAPDVEQFAVDLARKAVGVREDQMLAPDPVRLHRVHGYQTRSSGTWYFGSA